MEIPESYKNTTCCINCRKLDVAYNLKNTNNRNSRYCKKCNKHIYVYNDMPIANPRKFILYIVIGVIPILGMMWNEEPETIFSYAVVIFLFFGWLFRHEKDKINAIEIIMKEHLEKDFIVSNKNVIEDEVNEEMTFEDWKTEYFSKDPARKYMGEKEIMEVYLKQKPKN